MTMDWLAGFTVAALPGLLLLAVVERSRRKDRRSTVARQSGGRFVKVARMGPPSRIQRLWYRIIREPAPCGVEATSRHDWVRLVPWQLRPLHRRYAQRHRLAWTPCPLCDRPYGGHQHAGSIPDPTEPPSRFSAASIGICPACTRAGRSVDVRFPIEDELDTLADQHDHGHDKLIADCEACQHHDAAVRALIDHYREEQS